MLAILDTAVVSGLRGELVRVEVDVAPGLPGCQIVGLPDASLSEARERVRSAIRNAGFSYPLSRITVNLAPADRRKHGAAYDVAIAIGILVASEQIRASGGSWALLGELSLDGGIMPVAGVLPMVATLARRRAPPRLRSAAEPPGGPARVERRRRRGGRPGRRGPPGGRAAWQARSAARRRAPTASREARRARSPPRPGASRRGGLCAGRAVLDGSGGRARPAACSLGPRGRPGRPPQPAAAGSPGAGKTLLARATPGLLPPLTEAEAQEVAGHPERGRPEPEAGDRLGRPFLQPASHHDVCGAGGWRRGAAAGAGDAGPPRRALPR